MRLFENQKVRNILLLGTLLMAISFLTEGPLLAFLGESAHRDGQPLENLAWMYNINWFSFLNVLKASGFVMMLWAVFTGVSQIQEERIRWAWLLIGMAVCLLIFLAVISNNFIRFYNGFEGLFIFIAILSALTLIGAGAWLWWFYKLPESER